MIIGIVYVIYFWWWYYLFSGIICSFCVVLFCFVFDYYQQGKFKVSKILNYVQK